MILLEEVEDRALQCIKIIRSTKDMAAALNARDEAV